ncbi:MAG TPA: class I SAM-dependent methyltransferase [Micromonosporaceae bacterium]|jgi:ubiquinone/menaquinone biosynthesis C-methylase UbiE|nr:class I SAM-dependent methyltransferase [Micromonosporaceae bacterium]
MPHHNPRDTMFGMVSRPGRYDRMTSGPFRGVHARLVADVSDAGLGSGARVLDVGTGPGGVPLAIARAQPLLRVDGLDLSEDMIAYACQAATDAGLADRVTFTVGDVAHLPYPDGTFDLIVSSMSQHHWADVRGGVREVRRVLRPGGRAWIYDARIALHRATSAARREAGARAASTEPVRTGRLPIRLIGRLAITAEPALAPA